jgi:cAMP-dependent protein kinase regulator
LYDAPRAASIFAKTNCQLWELDRLTFNHIVKDAAQKKRDKYEEFLSKVEIFKHMSEYERSKIADSITEKVFSEGQTVMTQGEEGN